MLTNICYINKREYDRSDLVSFKDIRPQVLNLLLKDYPDFSQKNFISHEELNKYRKLYIEELVKKETKEINKLEKDVAEAIHSNQLLSENTDKIFDLNLTLGQKMADKIAEFGGSWSFIIIFFTFILLWIAVNVIALMEKPFDPYPFILLNLILSCLAAIQAPIIMMSQNRQEQKDRSRSEHDYKINLKAELEIRLLHEKLDHMIVHQNQRLIEIQQLQLDYLEEIAKNKLS
ncbi:MAG: DUF1003 domain-containing protein [Saprospiraceae bacterium]|nr:DUF1003 domain-containing protein [Saprospiraceae bacterium]